jgi:hypothetical protein
VELIEERQAVVEARAISDTSQLDATAATYGSEPPWFLPPNLARIEWEMFAHYPNYLAAQIVAGLFENEGLPSIVAAWASFPGIGSSTLWVPKQLMHRARWIAALAGPTDAELLFMATGEFSSPQE